MLAACAIRAISGKRSVPCGEGVWAGATSVIGGSPVLVSCLQADEAGGTVKTWLHERESMTFKLSKRGAVVLGAHRGDRPLCARPDIEVRLGA